MLKLIVRVSKCFYWRDTTKDGWTVCVMFGGHLILQYTHPRPHLLVGPTHELAVARNMNFHGSILVEIWEFLWSTVWSFVACVMRVSWSSIIVHTNFCCPTYEVMCQDYQFCDSKMLAHKYYHEARTYEFLWICTFVQLFMNFVVKDTVFAVVPHKILWWDKNFCCPGYESAYRTPPLKEVCAITVWCGCSH